MGSSNNDDLVEKLKEVFQSLVPSSTDGEIPEESLPLGTYVTVHRTKQLGIITDAFYGDLDADNKKIIVYTVLALPSRSTLSSNAASQKSRYYLTNEYEYEITAYLMIKPVDVKNLSIVLHKESY